VQVCIDARLPEHFVDERPIRLAIAIHHGHLVRADAVARPAQAGTRRLPHFAQGVRGARQLDRAHRIDAARCVGLAKQPRAEARRRRRFVGGRQLALVARDRRHARAERRNRVVARATRCGQEDRDVNAGGGEPLDQPQLELAHVRPDAVHKQRPVEARRVCVAIVIRGPRETVEPFAEDAVKARQLA